MPHDNGDEFMKDFHRAAQGKLSPFILVTEGSIPDEKKKRGLPGVVWQTLQPILTCDWIDCWLRKPGQGLPLEPARCMPEWHPQGSDSVR
jgi:hypothetical protein